MLCVLFIAARLRALMLDPALAQHQWWATAAFYLCTYSVLAQTLLVILLPQARKGSEGDIAFEAHSRALSLVLKVIRIFLLVCLYGGFLLIILSVVLMEHPKGADFTPSMPPALHCVVLLTVWFFAVYPGLMLATQAF